MQDATCIAGIGPVNLIKEMIATVPACAHHYHLAPGTKRLILLVIICYSAAKESLIKVSQDHLKADMGRGGKGVSSPWTGRPPLPHIAFGF